MEILSKDMLTLLNNEKVREAVEQVMRNTEKSGSTRTVEVEPSAPASSSNARQEPTQVTVRRIA